MRLWTIHPKYLDRQGLLGVWREGLLAQKVFGTDMGYSKHSQLSRFSNREQLSRYLHEVWNEARLRGYSFNENKIGYYDKVDSVSVTEGQLFYEKQRLFGKLVDRGNLISAARLSNSEDLLHPMFYLIPGEADLW